MIWCLISIHLLDDVDTSISLAYVTLFLSTLSSLGIHCKFCISAFAREQTEGEESARRERESESVGVSVRERDRERETRSKRTNQISYDI